MKETTGPVQIYFKCDNHLAKYTDSMLFDSGTVIAEAKYQMPSGKTFNVSLEVRGFVNVEYRGHTYTSPCEFPDELREIIKNDPDWWSASARTNGNDDEPIFCKENNWFEGIWSCENSSDGVIYESDLSKDTPKDVSDFFDDIVNQIANNKEVNVSIQNNITKKDILHWLTFCGSKGQLPHG